MKSKLHLLIFIGIIAGAAAGVLLSKYVDLPTRTFIINILDLFGKTIFIGALKMIVAPLIFFSIMSAITSLATTGELWRIGWKTLLFYFVTTSIAVAIGLFFVLTIRPGYCQNRDEIRTQWETQQIRLAEQYGSQKTQIENVRQKSTLTIIKNNLEKIVMNPFKALSDSQSLGIIFFAVLVGVAILVVGTSARPVIPIIHGLNSTIMKITDWVMIGAPFFIFCLVASLVGSIGPGVFHTIFWYIVVVLIALATHSIVLLAICYFVGGVDPWRLANGICEAWMIAFATRSSAATLPVTLDCVQNKLGVSPKIAEFVLPLGATVNMDGTALYEGISIIFLIQLFGGMPGAEIVLTPTVTVVIFLTAVLASVGAAAVPSAGLVTMVLVANAVGLSVEYIPLIFVVDAVLDMIRTATNVLGDSVGAVVINRLEKPG